MKKFVYVVVGVVVYVLTFQGDVFAQNQSENDCRACVTTYPGYQKYSDSIKDLLQKLKPPAVQKNKTMSFLIGEKEQLSKQLSEIIIFEGDFGVGELAKTLKKSVPQQPLEQYYQINKLIGQKQLQAVTGGYLNTKLSTEDFKLANKILTSIEFMTGGVNVQMFVFKDPILIQKKEKDVIYDTITYKQLFLILKAYNKQVGNLIRGDDAFEIYADGMKGAVELEMNFRQIENDYYFCFRKTQGSVCRGGERVKFQFKDRRDSNMRGFKVFGTSIEASIKRLKTAYSADSLRSILTLKNRISGNFLGYQIGSDVADQRLGEEWVNRKDNIYKQSVVAYQAIKQRNAVLAEPFDKKPCSYNVSVDLSKTNSIYEGVAESDKVLLKTIAEQFNDGACVYKDIIQDSMAGDLSPLTNQGPAILSQLAELGNKSKTLNDGISNYLKKQP